MRLKALNKVGIKEVPVMIVDWSEEQKRQFVVKDNLSYGVWDYEMIGADYGINELQEWGLDLNKFGVDEDIDFDNIQSNEDRSPAQKDIDITCPHCGETFNQKI
jgi:hypothetical protein